MAENRRRLKILVTGGGTGGHTTPAVATIQSIRELAEAEEIDVDISYLGSKHGVEKKSADELGVPFFGIETGKLRRASNAIKMINRQNLIDMLRVPKGFFEAGKLVRSLKPDVILSTGGYVSVPGVLAGAMAKIPIVAHEQTLQIGLANKINFRYASKIALSDDMALLRIGASQRAKAIVVGNPIRRVVFNGNAGNAEKKFGFAETDRDLPVVYITGGAQGSHIINVAVAECLPNLLEHARVIHQCGVQPSNMTQDREMLLAAVSGLDPRIKARYAVVNYVGPEIGDVYALADLIVGRSGAGTVSEVCALGKASIFVPLVPTGGDEQTRNAQRLVDQAAALLIKQSELSGAKLLAALKPILDDKKQRDTMAAKALKMAHPDAALNLAKLTLEIAQTKMLRN